ncbi:MAG: hypothetical protein ACREBO_07460 [Novosphingobium sp.]
MAIKTLAALAGLLILAGCGDMRERELSEQVMAAKVAAQQAQAAQAAAEKAAGIAAKSPTTTVEEDEPDEPSDENQVDVDTERGFVDADAPPNPARVNAAIS